MRATQVFIERTGGPEVIQLREVDLAAPGPGEALVRHEAIGINYIDTYHRSGLYPVALPSGLGMEAAGVVEAVGEGVTHLKAGDRVALMGGSLGAYSSARVYPVASLFPLPDGVDCSMAAALILKGATVETLVERCAPLKAGEWALVPAAAGGVGLLLVQWLKRRGVRVIGSVGSAGKIDAVLQAGAEHALLSDDPELAAKVREITGGAGVRVSYDGVGASSWESSLASIGRRGMLVSFGNASGPVTGVSLATLAAHGSLYVTRPTVFDYYRDPAERDAGMKRVWDMVLQGQISVTVGQSWPLAQAAEAHRALEARQTTGSSLLLP